MLKQFRSPRDHQLVWQSLGACHCFAHSVSDSAGREKDLKSASTRILALSLMADELQGV
jgi:hypothetical protein